MTGDENDKKSPPPGESRTVFMPSPLTYPPGSLPPGSSPPGGTPPASPPPDSPAADLPTADSPAEAAETPPAEDQPAPDAAPESPPATPDEGGPQATVWTPSPDAAPEAPAGAPPAPADHEATVWAPSGSIPPVPPPPPGGSAAPGRPGSVPPPVGTTAPGGSLTPRSQMPFTPISGDSNRRIQIGDVLNHIFEVTRFIGRGGMGEVFEGINVNTEERVAIKVILPHLAADPAVQAMFRKEARTLTRLSHPGLVQYRVLAQEPTLGALYIVTEFIEGANLSDQLGSLSLTPGQLTGLLRRLAQGLSVAHSLGAIHRDISPDNIMLEAGKLERARIIDFGIAKDLEGKSGTIVGDGFAGKLNYVAPEQLGDFGRDIGPWTDVYSLALTILATAIGKDVSMGATLVDAVDKRRAGVDVSGAPEVLRPVLEKMLAPNPADRLRSMEEVLAMLDSPDLKGIPGATQFNADGTAPARGGLSGKTIALAGGGLALVLAGAAALMMTNQVSGPAPGASGVADEAELPPLPPPADPVGTARKVIDGAFNSMKCSWLDVTNVEAQGNKVKIELQGVSGRQAEAVDRITKLIRRNGMEAASIDASNVFQIAVSMCRPIDVFSQIRTMGKQVLLVPQRQFEMDILPAESRQAGTLGARVVATMDLSGMKDEVALIGLKEDGGMELLAPDKASIVGGADENLGGDKYRFYLDTTHTGWSGMLVLTGKPPFTDANLTSTVKSRTIDWPDKFAAIAKQRGWHAEMVWYRTVDEMPNGRFR